MARRRIHDIIHWGGMPALGLFLFNVTLYMANAMVWLRGDITRELVPEIVGFFGGITVFSLILSPLMRRMGEGEGTFFAPFKWRCAVAIIPILYTPAIRLVGLETWSRGEAWRLLLLAGQGMLLPLVYSLFFLLTPRDRCGLWYGVNFAAGVATSYLARLGVGAPEEAAARITLLFFLRTALLAALACALLCSLVQWRAALRRDTIPSPRADFAPGRSTEILRVFVAATLFFVMNGFLQGRLFPFYSGHGSETFPEIPFLVVVVCPLVGHYLDRNHRYGARRILRVCAVLFMLAPALAVLDMAHYSYRVLFCLLILARFSTSMAATRTLALLAGAGPFHTAIVSSVAFLQVVSLAGQLLFQESLRLNSGFVVLLSIIAAMLLYGLTGRILVDDAEKAPSPDAAPADAAQAIDNAPVDEAAARQALFAARQLTPRESEIASMLITGASTRDMARELGISENTVTTHVKNVLRKFSLPSRKAFMAAFIRATPPVGGVEEEDGDDRGKREDFGDTIP